MKHQNIFALQNLFESTSIEICKAHKYTKNLIICGHFLIDNKAWDIL
jgi:hypothetical protein